MTRRKTLLLAALAALAASFLLTACGGASPRHSQNPRLALERLSAPSGFRAGPCEFAQPGQYTRCYRRKQFTPLDEATFASLITESGLAPDPSTILCPHLLRQRARAAVARDTCQGHASLGSVDLIVAATSLGLRSNKPRRSDLEVARALQGTVYEVRASPALGAS